MALRLNKLYNSKDIKNIESLIDNITTLDNDKYEVEVCLWDERYSCSKSLYTSFNLDNFNKINYTDTVIVSYKVPVKCSYLRSNLDRSIVEKKIMISAIESDSSKLNPRVKLRLNYEDDVEYSPNVLTKLYDDNFVQNYQRKQRISYMSHIPLLSNWRVDKTVRFYADTPNNMKMTKFLDESNVITADYYDSLDIEFEYVGNYTEFKESYFKLLELVYPNEFETFNIVYSRANNILHKDHNILLNSVFTNVGIITNDFVKNEDLTNYVYEEKYDGEHVILVVLTEINENNVVRYVYEYTKRYFKLIYYRSGVSASLSAKTYSLSIVEAECITTPTPLYILFDCVVLNNKLVSDLAYTDRLKQCYKFAKIYGDILQLHIAKCMLIKSNTAKVWNSLLSIVNTRCFSTDPALGSIKTDGLIIRSKTGNKLYKLKNSILSTIDCMLKWVDTKQVFYLYLIGNRNEVFKRYPIVNSFSTAHHGYSLANNSANGAFILFDNPFIPKLYEFEVNKYWFNAESAQCSLIDPELKQNIDSLMNKLAANPVAYNSRIFEMSLYRDSSNKYQWLPIRERVDKPYPNGYKIGVSNIETIYNPVSVKYLNTGPNVKPTLNISYFGLSLSRSDVGDNIMLEQAIISMFDKQNDKNNSFNQIGKNIIWNTHNAYFFNNIFKYVDINNLYIMSNDKSNLCDIYNTITLSNKQQSTNIIDISCVYYNDNDSFRDIEDSLSRFSYTKQSIDVLFDLNPVFSKEYVQFLKNVIKPTGTIVFYCDNVDKTLFNDYIITKIDLNGFTDCVKHDHRCYKCILQPDLV